MPETKEGMWEHPAQLCASLKPSHGAVPRDVDVGTHTPDLRKQQKPGPFYRGKKQNPILTVVPGIICS